MDFCVSVNGHRMMDGCYRGEAETLNPKNSVREALIVMKYIKAPHLVSKKPIGTDTEGKRLWKSPGRNADPFKRIDRRAQLMEFGYPEKVFRIIEIKAGQPMEDDVFVQMRIRRAGHHIDRVPEILQGTAYPLDIDTLPAACRIPFAGLSPLRPVCHIR